MWFVVGLPVFLRTELGWSFWEAGAFLAVWVIGYGAVQAATPGFARKRADGTRAQPDGRAAAWLAFVLAACPAGMALALEGGVDPTLVVFAGLAAFGVVFALNSTVHSYLILAYAENARVAMSVGFYYMANAGGRLLGTILSGLLYQWNGLTALPLGLCRIRPRRRSALAAAAGELSRQAARAGWGYARANTTLKTLSKRMLPSSWRAASATARSAARTASRPACSIARRAGPEARWARTEVSTSASM